MTQSPFDLVAVNNNTTRHAAESLIREYLTFINDSALQNYQLSFDIEAMIASDINDPTKFYPPPGRFYRGNAAVSRARIRGRAAY